MGRGEYKTPSCWFCKCDLFLEEVYHRGHLYRVDPVNGQPDKSQDFSTVMQERERLDFERLVCLKCHRCYEVKYDRQNRLIKGGRY